MATHNIEEIISWFSRRMGRRLDDTTSGIWIHENNDEDESKERQSDFLFHSFPLTEHEAKLMREWN